MVRLIWVFTLSDDGATAIEYGLIAGLIAVAAIVGMTAAGGAIRGAFNYISSTAGGVWDNALS